MMKIDVGHLMIEEKVVTTGAKTIQDINHKWKEVKTIFFNYFSAI